MDHSKHTMKLLLSLGVAKKQKESTQWSENKYNSLCLKFNKISIHILIIDFTYKLIVSFIPPTTRLNSGHCEVL